jgi:heptosyltransferase-1
MIFIHSTSWESKCWQEKNWRALTEKATGEGFQVVFPWGNSGERERARRIAAAGNNALVLPDLSISEKASLISGAHATVGLDTGLSHIAAALDVPSITLYGATDPLLCGATGKNQIHLVSGFKCVRCHQAQCTYPGADKPCCFTELSPDRVWNALQTAITARC